jgi:hypothetical protein
MKFHPLLLLVAKTVTETEQEQREKTRAGKKLKEKMVSKGEFPLQKSGTLAKQTRNITPTRNISQTNPEQYTNLEH